MWGEFHISLLPIISGFGPTFHKLNPIILVLSSSLLHIPPKWCQLIKHKKKSQWGTRNRNTTGWDAIEYRAEPANLSHVSPSCHDEGAARWLPTLNWCFNFLSDYNVPSIQFCYNNKRFYPKHTHFSILGRGVCVCVWARERERAFPFGTCIFVSPPILHSMTDTTTTTTMNDNNTLHPKTLVVYGNSAYRLINI